MYRFLTLLLITIVFSACTAAPELTLLPVQDREREAAMSSLPEPDEQPEVSTTVDTQDAWAIYRFDSVETAGRWAIVNDSVMGGISESGLALSESDTLLFAGNLSLENNGGFASVRSVREALGITDETGIRLTVRGDGKLYHLRLYAPDRRNVAYEAAFQTANNEWQTIELPFSTFEPTYFGQVLTDYRPLAPDTIEGLGFMIKEYQVGAFALEVAAIEAYR